MKFFLCLWSIFLIVSQCGSVPVDRDLKVTSPQKQLLDKFKAIVLSRLPHDYMKEDIYLIRWLRARNFNVKEAELMLMKNLAWRKQNRMDDIQKEDWSDLRKQYKYWIDGVDKEGRPNVGEWDIRKGVLAGKAPQLGRLIDKVLDEVNIKIRELQSQGHKVTQYYHIYDMEGFNLAQHGCPGCIPIVLRLITTYESYFPGSVHKLVLINTPTAFQTLLEVMRPLMSPLTRDRMVIYGKNKQEGQQALLKDIDKDQLALELGGTRAIPNY